MPEPALDPITGFLEECCVLARNARYPALDLYLTYVYWCLEKGIPVQDQFTFLDVMESHGLRYRERKRGSWVRGVSVLPRYRIDV